MNYDFFTYCQVLRGFRFFRQNGKEIYKYELFTNNVNPETLLINGKYSKKERDNKKDFVY